MLEQAEEWTLTQSEVYSLDHSHLMYRWSQEYKPKWALIECLQLVRLLDEEEHFVPRIAKRLRRKRMK